MLIISIVGVFGNISGIISFGKTKSSQKIFYSFMFYLAIFDLIYIIVGLLLFVFPHLSVSYITSGPWYYIVPWAIPIGQISMTGSVYFTTGITIERYLTVCHPFFMFSRNLSSKKISFGIIMFSVFIFKYFSQIFLPIYQPAKWDNILLILVAHQQCTLLLILSSVSKSNLLCL